MARRVFYSFHYKPDNWRVAQIRSIGALDGNKAATDNDWEKVTDGGDAEIKRWINDQMFGRGCAIVLVGQHTAGRKWINYEIEKAWNDGKGVLGIYIHNLKNSNQEKSSKGSNPFSQFEVDGKKLSSIVKCYDPPYVDSSNVYAHIKDNVEDWIEESIRIRKSM